MNKLKISILTVFLFTVSFIFLQNTAAQNRSDRTVIAAAERISQDTFTVTTQTPKGVRVLAVKKPSSQMLKAIDEGFTTLFEIAGKHNYRRRLNYSDYTVFIASPDRQKSFDGQYAPDIAVPAGQYAGTIYDNGGYIYAAGMVIAYNPCAFLIGEHAKDFDRVSNVVRYEGEHIVLYHNDRKLYNETADHSKGGSHPILQ